MNIFQTIIRRLPAAVLAVLAISFLYQCKTDSTEAGTVNVRMEAAPKTLNPYLSNSAYVQAVTARIFQTLGGINPQTLKLEPMLVKSIPTTRSVQDGPHKGMFAYDFEILKEAVWDNGTPVTANDLLFTIKTIFHPGLPIKSWRGYYEFFDGMDIDPANPKKFTAYFKQFYILNEESICQTPLLPSYLYDPQSHMGKFSLADLMDEKKAATMKDDPDLKAYAEAFQEAKYANDKAFVIGSGPYRLENMNEQGLTFNKKEHWWGDALASQYPQLIAAPQRLVYKVVKDDGAIENMLKTGEIDIATAINPAKFNEWKQDATLQSNYDFKTLWVAQFNRLQLNNQNPKLADKRVRQALAYAIDYDYMVKTVIQGIGRRSVGPINPGESYYAKDLPLYDFNIQKAKALLAEAGWKDTDGNGIVDKVINGKKTDLTLGLLSTNVIKVSEMLSNSIQQSALQAGIKVEIVPLDISELSKKTIAGDYDMALYGGGLYPGLADMYQNFHSSNLAPDGDNRSRYVNPKMDSVLAAIRTTEEVSRRHDLYVTLQGILHDEVPEIYLYAPDQRFIASKKFNYVISSNRPGYYEQMFKPK